MSSTNHLCAKSQLSEFKSGSDKDTISEASESGASSTISSAEDLQKVALILGLSSIDEVYQERFRIDRRRLEIMITDIDEAQNASTFFHKVMYETNTIINWPARLKVGARSKKDPHVRIAGRIEDVRRARDRIMQLLDTRSNRVTMKLDVSYTDHSHIIGKGGLTIKRVMEETSCHIHFPDSNRSSSMEKSNQVSIAGDMENIEKAREKVRMLMPLIFCFELPIMNASQPMPDVNSPYVQQIQEKYNVQVMLRTRAKLHASLVVVKGVQWEVEMTMEATSLLINYMCGSLANQTYVQMTLEISPMHHQIILGRKATQLKAIMQATKTQIMFPDAEDPNTPTIKKSNVTITGHIKDVFTARQQLIGCLPLVILFDVNEDNIKIDNDLVSHTMQNCNVFINIRRKPRQPIVSVIIKGIERDAGDIYEARRLLLGAKDPIILAKIPDNYHIPESAIKAVSNFSHFNPFSPSHNTNLPTTPLNCSPMNPHTGRQDVGYSPGYGSPAMSPGQWNVVPPSPQQVQVGYSYPQAVPVQNQVVYTQGANSNNWNVMNEMSRIQQQHQHQQHNMMMQQYQTMASNTSSTNTLNQLLNISSQASSGYQSNFSGSTVSLDTHSISGGDSSNNESSNMSPAISPISKHSQTSSTDANRSNELAHLLNELATADPRAVGSEKKTLDAMKALSPFANYNQLKAEANKAMRENIGSGYRVPTTKWSGCYFSQTSPSAITLPDSVNMNNEEVKPVWNPNDPLVRPNIVNKTALTPVKKTPTKNHLNTLFSENGLDKYIHLFERHEIDIRTFQSLNEADLMEIGVTAFGARRKMLLLIADHNNRTPKNGGPCPVPSIDAQTPKNYPSHSVRDDKW